MKVKVLFVVFVFLLLFPIVGYAGSCDPIYDAPATVTDVSTAWPGRYVSFQTQRYDAWGRVWTWRSFSIGDCVTVTRGCLQYSGGVYVSKAKLSKGW